jgi:hypothetical protein
LEAFQMHCLRLITMLGVQSKTLQLEAFQLRTCFREKLEVEFILLRLPRSGLEKSYCASAQTTGVPSRVRPKSPRTWDARYWNVSCDERQKSRMESDYYARSWRVSVCVCLSVHACARVLECACMSASSPHRAYSRCCRSSGPLGRASASSLDENEPTGRLPRTCNRCLFVCFYF